LQFLKHKKVTKVEKIIACLWQKPYNHSWLYIMTLLQKVKASQNIIIQLKTLLPRNFVLLRGWRFLDGRRQSVRYLDI